MELNEKATLLDQREDELTKLRIENKGLKGEVKELKEAVERWQTNCRKLEGKLKNLKGEVEVKQSAIDSLK